MKTMQQQKGSARRGASCADGGPCRTGHRKWFFDSEERRTQLLWEANSWVGTKFHAFSRIKGVGVDCVQLAGAIYIATGALEHFTPGRYNLDHSQHHEESLVESYVREIGRFAEISGAMELMPGDLICFWLGRTTHHVGIYLGGDRFVHALSDYFVVVASLKDSTWKKRVAAVYRPLAIAVGSNAPAEMPAVPGEEVAV